MGTGFERIHSEDGINVFFSRTDKFKTVSVRVLLQQPLQQDSVTMNALIPRVLKRGTKNHPTLRQLAERLEDLYGAKLMSDVSKTGDRQVLIFGLDMAASHFVGRGPELLAEGAGLLSELLLSPVMEEGTLSPGNVSLEKEGLKRQARALLNDKAQYCMVRCVTEMFKGEPFGLHHLGRAEDVDKITPEALTSHYNRVVRESPVDFFIVGDISDKQAIGVVDEVRLPKALRSHVPSAPAPVVTWEPRHMRESQPVNQGKVTMGYRTGATLRDASIFNTIMFEGILGGFPHSKLFLNVREREGLAYYAQSMLDNSKGLMYIIAGIEPKKYEKALEVIEQQVNDLRHGRFTEDELESTRRSLMHRVRASEDSVSSKISIFWEYALAKNPRSVDERLKAIQNVTRQQVIDAANNVHLDLVYFVGPEGGRQQ